MNISFEMMRLNSISRHTVQDVARNDTVLSFELSMGEKDSHGASCSLLADIDIVNRNLLLPTLSEMRILRSMYMTLRTQHICFLANL